MIIANSSIGMDSARKYTSVSQDSRKITSEVVQFSLNSYKQKVMPNESSEDDIDEESNGLTNPKQSFNDIFSKMKAFATSSSYEDMLANDSIDEIRKRCLQYILYLLFGLKSDDFELDAIPDSNIRKTNVLAVTTSTSLSSFYAEEEETSFSTTGTVVTSDGRELSFNLDLNMSRSFASYYEQNFSSTKIFTDPLVINLDASIAEVSDVKVSFDLDCDGEADNISVLSPKSGYLALDKNSDGIINDGSELFGTASGDGFKDLSEYDLDGNGFIDEADDVFDKLKICVLEEDGSQTLYTLKEKGVGAICLDSASTDFSLNSLNTNECNARIRRTGIFLYENGGIGTMQHLDLAQ